MDSEMQKQNQRQQKQTWEVIGPNTAIDIGYNLYLCDQCTDPQMASSAKTAIDQFNRIASQAAQTSPEGAYYTQIRVAANSLARGISRRKQILRDKLQAAHQRKEDRVRRIAQTELFIGILRGGFRLLLLGGVTYAVTRAVFGITFLEMQLTGLLDEFTAIALALGIALIGSFFKARFMARRVMRIFAEFDVAITSANQEYSHSVIQEYRLAAGTANQAWRDLTGTDPPDVGGLENLLIGVMGGNGVDKQLDKSPNQGKIKKWIQSKRRDFGSKAAKLIDKVRESR